MAKVVVVGGGVGGLSTAIALQRAGIETVVLERLDDVERAQLGAGLTLAYNATRAFDAIGLKEKLREAGTLYVDSEFRTASGERLARWSVPSTELQVGIARQALHRVLLDALEPGTLRSGAQCNGFGQDAGGVSVFTNNGDVECDVLVGADGLNGRVRPTLQGHAEPRYAGYKVWRALVRFEHELAPPGLFRMLWGRGARFAFYHVGPGLVYWFGVANAPAGTRDPKGRRVELLLDRFGGWHAPTAELIRSASEDEIHETDIYDRPPGGDWGAGRVTLLGDAAHPMTFNLGQGACQAVESAVTLGDRLARSPSDPAAALRTYEQDRRARTDEMTNLSWRIGAAGRLRNPAACFARDRLIKLTFDRFVVPRQEKFLAFEP